MSRLRGLRHEVGDTGHEHLNRDGNQKHTHEPLDRDDDSSLNFDDGTFPDAFFADR